MTTFGLAVIVGAVLGLIWAARSENPTPVLQARTTATRKHNRKSRAHRKAAK